MTDHHDIEETLKQFKHEPAPKSKQAVMNAYRNAFAARPGIAFWKRPIPLYAAAIIAIVLVGVSFVAGLRSSMGVETRVSAPEENVDGAVTSQDIEWRPAQNDLL
jgi:hypothetical protein